MIYTVQRVRLIAEQLRRFSDADSWIVAGQFVNLEFWLDEVKSALEVMDQHNSRFEKMYNARENWIETHNIHIPDNCPICQGICELGTGSRKPRMPKRSAETKTEKKDSRIELIDSTYFFLLRCYKLKLIDEDILRHKCKEIGTSVDYDDLID